MRLSFAAIAAALALGLAAPAAAASPDRPWEAAAALARKTHEDFNKGGFAAIGPHVLALKAALAAVGDPIRKTYVVGGTTYILSENATDSLAGMMGQVVAQDKGAAPPSNVTSIIDPYPDIALLLGSYYNENGRSEDALWALDRGLGAAPDDPGLVSEKAVAFVGEHRWADALALYQHGAATPGLEPTDKARMLRGQGLALTELHRLDEAEAAYKASLELTPGNALAQNELTYIARLRAGGETAPTALMAPNAHPPGN